MAINSDMKPHAMGLHSEMLQDFRDNLDEMLRMLVLNMTDRDLMEGVLTAKIKIVMNKPEYGGFTEMKIEPDISLKIGAKGTKKCETQQGIYLRYDQDGTPVIAGSQITLDEYIRSRNDGAA